MVYQQVHLCHDTSELTCWVGVAKPLRRRQWITLKGDERRWEVVEVYTPLLDEPPQKDWKVGGLT